MNKYILAGLLLLCTSSGFAQVRDCQYLLLPDQSGPEPTSQPIVGYYFTVPPTTTDLFYPFDIQVNRQGDGRLSVSVIQNIYNDPAKQQRVFNNLTRVSLVEWSSDIEHSYVSVSGGVMREMALTVMAGYQSVRDWMRLLGYTVLPSPLTPQGVENTWGIRFDSVVRQVNLNRAMSKPLHPGERWNVGIYAPYGIYRLGLQVGLEMCP